MSDLLVSIRHAKPHDAPALSKVFDAAWREAYRGIIPGVALEKMLDPARPALVALHALARRPLAVLDIGQGDGRLRVLRPLPGPGLAGRGRDRRTLPAAGIPGPRLRRPPVQGRAQRPARPRDASASSSGRWPTTRGPARSTRPGRPQRRAGRRADRRRSARQGRLSLSRNDRSGLLRTRIVRRAGAGPEASCEKIHFGPCHSLSGEPLPCASTPSRSERTRRDDVNVIIEVPLGGEPIKYEMDKESGTLVRRPVPVHLHALSGELRLHSPHALGRRRPLRRAGRQHPRHRRPARS